MLYSAVLDALRGAWKADVANPLFSHTWHRFEVTIGGVEVTEIIASHTSKLVGKLKPVVLALKDSVRQWEWNACSEGFYTATRVRVLPAS